MDQPAAPKSLLHNRLLLVVIVLFTLLVCLFVAVYNFARPQLAGLLPSATATPPCGESRLVLGSSRYQIQPAPSEWQGILPAVPSDQDVVYWIGGGNPNYILVFNPGRQNQVALGTLKAGMPITVNWEDCNTGGYKVEKVELRSAFDPAQVDPRLVGVTLYLPLDATGRGLVVTASALLSPASPSMAGHTQPLTLFHMRGVISGG